MTKFFLKTPRRGVCRPAQDRRRQVHNLQTTATSRGLPYGAYWRQARKMCLAELVSARRLESNYLERDVVHMGRLVTTPEQFRWMLDELFLLNGVLNIGDWSPWLGWLDLQGMKTGSITRESASRRRTWWTCFYVAGDPCLEVKFSRDSVKAFTQDLIAGGTESSAAVTVEWAIAELLRMPKVFAKATEELDRVISHGRWVTEKDIPSLPYINAIVKETMRMHPVAIARGDQKLAVLYTRKGSSPSAVLSLS
uniref:Uncharacterized protein n=1 Tax=Oryza brachyantha TaxID=4533 RepID=J3KVB5_ORYBR